MSYLGRKPIKIPEHVNIKMTGNSLLVEGPLGSWKRKVDSRILFEINETNLTIQKPVEKKDLPLHCPLPEMSLWNSHPRVYLPIEESGKAKCPYCGTEFTLKG